MKLQIKIFNQNDDQKTWNDFCDCSVNATFLHTRNYINYHKNRFIDESLLIYDEKKLLALLPAAIDLNDKTTVVSHPGLSHGGLIHNEKTRGDDIYEIFTSIIKFYKARGFKQLIYRSLPNFYKSIICNDDLFAIFRNNGQIVDMKLTSTIDFNKKIDFSQRRRRSYKKSLIYNLNIQNKIEYLKDFWELLNDNLLQRHSVRPTHTFEEILHLIKIFPSNIKLITVVFEGKLLCGTILYLSNKTVHTQYVASNNQGRNMNALDFLFNEIFLDLAKKGYQWFDFGNSNEPWGLNSNLYKFKTEFGAESIAIPTYQLSL